VIFAWDEWNREHIAEHNVSAAEAEYVVRKARRPFPREIADEKRLVWGETEQGRFLQVIFVFRSEDEVELDTLSPKDQIGFAEHNVAVGYIIHARDMTAIEKSRLKRLRK
jgi:uncharacterized DUF497 family protein